MSVIAGEKSFLDRFLAYWLPVLVMLTGIVVLSAQPHLKPPIEFPQSDKVFHLLEYGTLGFLLARAVRGSLPGQSVFVIAVLAVGLGACVGAGDEYFQSFVPGRESSALDWVADVTGLIVGLIAYRWRAWR
ncbi:MAG: VanZ family protein [Candidatus Eiseniibacteriota bacterium]